MVCFRNLIHGTGLRVTDFFVLFLSAEEEPQRLACHGDHAAVEYGVAGGEGDAAGNGIELVFSQGTFVEVLNFGVLHGDNSFLSLYMLCF